MSKIEWTDGTWNPVTGCLHGCPYCYARRMAARLKGMRKPGYENGFEPTFHRDRLHQPARWRKPRKIFTGSMADLFGEWVSDGWIHAVLEVIRDNPRHTFQLLTKNPERYREYTLPRNAWAGATATDQASWDRACDALQRVDASVRFISAEPLLGWIRPGKWMPDWLIIGAQTGPGAVTPPDDAVRFLSSAAEVKSVPIFHKDNLPLPRGWCWRRLQFPEIEG